MLQLQYFNTKLKNKHINNILDNYKLKYSGIKNILNTKISELITLFLKDISNFLENTEEVANAKKKLNNYEKMKNELESIRNQLKIKIFNEHKIKNELEVLNQENSLLKVKIKSLKQKLNNLNINDINNLNTNNKKRPKSPIMNKTARESNLTTPKINQRAFFNNENKKIVSEFRRNYNNSIERKTSVENSINKLDLSLTSKFDYSSRVLENVEKSNSRIRKKNQLKNIYITLKKSSAKKEMIPDINNNINNNINTTIKKKKNIKKFLINKDKLNKSNITINNNKNKINSFITITPYQLNINTKNNISNIKEFKESNNNSQNNSEEIINENNKEYEDFENKINSAIDEELKQLELDEEKIKTLLEKINNGNSTDINYNISNTNNTNNIEDTD